MPALRSLSISATYGRSNDAALADFFVFVVAHLMQLTRLAVLAVLGDGAHNAGAVLRCLSACEALPALHELVLAENESLLPLLRHPTLCAESLSLQWNRPLSELPPAVLTSLTELRCSLAWFDENAPTLACLTRLTKLHVSAYVISLA